MMKKEKHPHCPALPYYIHSLHQSQINLVRYSTSNPGAGSLPPTRNSRIGYSTELRSGERNKVMWGKLKNLTSE